MASARVLKYSRVSAPIAYNYSTPCVRNHFENAPVHYLPQLPQSVPVFECLPTMEFLFILRGNSLDNLFYY